jgi:hypothetical protein
MGLGRQRLTALGIFSSFSAWRKGFCETNCVCTVDRAGNLRRADCEEVGVNTKIMNERPADKLWKDLTPEQVSGFFKTLVNDVERKDELANKILVELAKYLFTANTGAAAGLLYLLKTSPGQIWYLLSFFSFCGGTFFVGVSYLTLARWSRKFADGAAEDINAWGRNELTIAGRDINNRKQYALRKRTAEFWGLWISFILLVCGGLLAAVALWKTTQ